MVENSGAPLRSDRLRPLNEPQPIEVELDKKQLPASVAQGTVTRDVTRVLEVWRVDDEWWRKGISRRYVEVVLDNGHRQVLFEDLNTGEWFEHRA